MFQEDATSSISHLGSWLGFVIDLPYFDLVVGVTPQADPTKGVAYNYNEGNNLTKAIQSIKETTILIISQQFSFPKPVMNNILNDLNIKHITAYLSVVRLIPEANNETQIELLDTPKEMLEPKEGIVARPSNEMLNMLYQRFIENEETV